MKWILPAVTYFLAVARKHRRHRARPGLWRTFLPAAPVVATAPPFVRRRLLKKAMADFRWWTLPTMNAPFAGIALSPASAGLWWSVKRRPGPFTLRSQTAVWPPAGWNAAFAAKSVTSRRFVFSWRLEKSPALLLILSNAAAVVPVLPPVQVKVFACWS